MRAEALLGLGILVYGCGSLPPQDPVEMVSGRGLSGEEYEAYRKIVAEKTVSPRNLLDMRDALACLESMIKTRPGDFDVMVLATETASWLADHAEGAARSSFAEKAVQYGREAVKLNGWSGRAQYALAVALGYYVREEPSRALAMIPEMEAAAKAAAGSDERVDEAGPHRYLALLYAQAPGFPTSVGDVELAMKHADKAVELFPKSPETHIARAEVLLEDDGEDEAKKELTLAGELLATAPPDERAELQKKIDEFLAELGETETP